MDSGRYLSLLVFLLGIIVLPTTGLPENPVIQTVNGVIRGETKKTRTGESYFSFWGITYAEPPTGDNRFRPAVPKNPWTGQMNATKAGSYCAQWGSNKATGSENCLVLNVFTKNFTGDQPVLLFIHGGALITGNSAGYDPDYLIDRADIVFVSIQYRLGPFGFLSTGDEFAPGNYGFKDQNLALQWVRDNIRAFGGNPNVVTIFGQSAGAMSVTAHVVSPMSKGLFHRAIASSGSTISHLKVNNTYYTYELAKVLACPVNSSELLVNCVRTKSTKDILTASAKLDFKENIAVMRWNYEIEDPSSGNPFLTEHPNTILREGRFNKVPILLGITKDEFAFYAKRVIDDSKLLNEFNENFDVVAPYAFLYERESNRSLEISESLRNYYLINSTVDISSTNSEGLEKLFADSVISHGVHLFVELARKYSDIYYYRFNYISGYTHGNYKSSRKPAGVFHTDNIQYIFVTTGFRPLIKTSDKENSIVQKMTGWITQFVKYGNPNSRDDEWISDVTWSPSNATDLLTFNINSACELSDEPYHDRFLFWDRIFENLE